MSAREPSNAIDIFLRYPFTPIRSNELYRRAWSLVHQHQILTIYDGLYVALADLYATPVWTADQRLLRTIGPNMQLVRWIGDYEG